MESYWNGAEAAPVSYTHLDVYKRQTLYGGFASLFCKHWQSSRVLFVSR